MQKQHVPPRQTGEAIAVRSTKEKKHGRYLVDRSGATGAHLSVRRWHEADPAARGADQANATAGPVRAVYRRGRGARRDRPDPPRAPARPAGPDTTGCRRAG